MAEQVLVIGSGGREHTIAWKLSMSNQVAKVYVSPGNAGTSLCSKISNAAVNVKNFDDVISWCGENKISLVVVGPEDPLANGIADALTNAGIPCFGPSAKAAQIEASKEFAKTFMDKYNLPTARWKSFTNADEACHHIQTSDYPALVIKASGLAAGKGVVVAENKDEACQAARQMLEDKLFGAASDVVVVEELLEGEEVSCLCFTDGSTLAAMPPAQDHKRLGEGDVGPNTGGMGAYCPCPQVSLATLRLIEANVLQRAVDGMKSEGSPYVGVLYAGLMLTKDGPKVLEFNCRFGDPETQVLLPTLKSDLFATMMACAKGNLASAMPEFYSDRFTVAVVMASGGYPGSYKKGVPITGIDSACEKLDVQVFHAGTTMKESTLVTSGGRVLAVVSSGSSLSEAARIAQLGASAIQFEGAIFRKDIAHKGLRSTSTKLSYKGSGVDIGAGDSLVQAIKPLAKGTTRPGCMGDLGGFGGLFDCKAAGFSDPVLVSGTDGVGTKLKIAQHCGRHDTIGVDLVAMCVNDVLAHGAEPLFFLDYFSCGKLDVLTASDVIRGVTAGCQQAGCSLLGGETAEMPGMYAPGEYDLAGFTVGAVERNQILPLTNKIAEGDVIIGLSSSGIHSNGFSLVRRVMEHCGVEYSTESPFDGKTWGELLLTPTKIYVKSVLPCMKQGLVKAFAHITGGGLVENIPRVMPAGLGARLDARNWTVQPVFGWLASKGNIEDSEMLRTFNCGIGGILVVSSDVSDQVLQLLHSAGESASRIGQVVSTKGVTVDNFPKALSSAWSHVEGPMNGVHKRKRVGVLISGSGTNLQALIDHTTNPRVKSCAEIALVISNVAGVMGLERAKSADIPTLVINHKEYKKRLDFDNAVTSALEAAGVELICLAGFMRIVTGEFVRHWNGKLLNVHPSLLPSFKGMHAHKLVLEAGVRLSGCSVHFVAEEVDAGAIIVQESVPVLPGDTIETLQERVKTAEHKAFPQALELLASGQVALGLNNKLEWNLRS